MENEKTLSGKINGLAEVMSEAIAKAVGISVKGQALLAVGFLVGYYGLREVFAYCVWSFIFLTAFRFVKEVGKKKDDSPGADMTGVEVPPHEPDFPEMEVFVCPAPRMAEEP